MTCASKIVRSSFDPVLAGRRQLVVKPVDMDTWQDFG